MVKHKYRYIIIHNTSTIKESLTLNHGEAALSKFHMRIIESINDTLLVRIPRCIIKEVGVSEQVRMVFGSVRGAKRWIVENM